LTDAVDGVDETVVMFVLFSVGRKQLQLSGGKRHPVADQAHMPDPYAPGPGQSQSPPGKVKEHQVIGRRRFGGQLAGLPHAVRIIENNGNAPSGLSAPTKLSADLLDQTVQNALQRSGIVGIVAEFVIGDDFRWPKSNRQDGGWIDSASSLEKMPGPTSERHF
jgi:hypothetical protein